MDRNVPARVLCLSSGAFWLFAVPSSRGLEEVADGDADTAELVARALDAEQVRRCVDELPSRERLVVHLHYGFAGRPMPLREVADYCGLSRSTVSVAHRRGLELLRARYLQVGPPWPSPSGQSRRADNEGRIPPGADSEPTEPAPDR